MSRRRLTAVAGTVIALTAVASVALVSHISAASPILRTVAVGKDPTGLVVDESAGRVFVANIGDDSVSVLSASSGAVLRTLPLDGRPGAMAVDQPRGRVFILVQPPAAGPTTLVTLDVHSGARLSSVVVGDGAGAIAVDERTGRAFVTNSLDDSVSMVDASGRRVLRTAAVGTNPNLGYNPQAVAVDVVTGRVFVANTSTDSVSVFDARTGARLRVVLSRTPSGGWEDPVMAIDAASGRIFVTNLYNNGVSMLDARSGAILHTTRVGMYSRDMVLSPRSSRILEIGDNGMNVLDARTGALLRTIPIGSAGYGTGAIGMAAVDERSSRVFVVHQGGMAPTSDTWNWLPGWLRSWLPWAPPRVQVSWQPMAGSISVFDLGTGALLRTIPLGVNAGPVAVDERTARAFVLNMGTFVNGFAASRGTVSVVDASQ